MRECKRVLHVVLMSRATQGGVWKSISKHGSIVNDGYHIIRSQEIRDWTRSEKDINDVIALTLLESNCCNGILLKSCLQLDACNIHRSSKCISKQHIELNKIVWDSKNTKFASEFDRQLDSFGYAPNMALSENGFIGWDDVDGSGWYNIPSGMF